MINKKKYSFRSRDGVIIKGICMIPDEPKAIFQMVHGMDEHKERYLSFMEEMAQRGYITLMHDNRGHGESIYISSPHEVKPAPSDSDNDNLGYCFDDKDKGLVYDVHVANMRIRKEFPGLPLILYGHSMGSLIARAYLKQYDDEIDGLIVSGCPSYNSFVPFGRVLVECIKMIRGERYRSQLVSNLVTGTFDKNFKSENIKNAWISADREVSEKFNSDPLCQFKYTLNGYETLLNLEYTVYKDRDYIVTNPGLPVFFYSGREDPCYISMNKWESAIKHMEKLGYDNVTATMFENMRHEIHNEKDKQLVFDEYDKCCKYCIKMVSND